MEAALMTLLLADAGVTAQLGARINWLRRPQAEDGFPAAVLQRVAGARDYHMGAASGLVSSSVQVDVWGETYAAAKLASAAIVAAVSGYRAGTIQGIFVEAERDLADETADANIRLFRITLDLQIWHTE